MVKVICCGLAALGLCVTTAFAQSSFFQILGETRTGTASATFLKIGVGARGMAMGEAFVAVTDDATSLYWNPAGSDDIASTDVALTHVRWVADVQYEHAAVVHRLGDFGVVGVQAAVLHTDDMIVTDEYHPHGVQYADGSFKMFSFGDFMTGATFSSRLIDRFSYGISAKFVSETLDDLVMRGLLLDVGLIYRVGVNNAQIGMSLTNLGADLAPSGTFTMKDVTGAVVRKDHESFSPPTTFRLGFSLEPYATEGNAVKAAFSVDRPSDSQEIYRIGTEYSFEQTFFLRGGYKLNNRITGGDISGLSLGFGARIQTGGFNVRADYAFTSLGELKNFQVITLAFSF